MYLLYNISVNLAWFLLKLIAPFNKKLGLFVQGRKDTFKRPSEADTKQEWINSFDKVLIASGREANTKGYGVEELDLPLNERGSIEVNDFLQTRFPNIFACRSTIAAS